MNTHLIIVELIKAITIGCFLFLFYYVFKKAFYIGQTLNNYLKDRSIELEPKYKKALLSEVVKRFFSFYSFVPAHLEIYLSEVVIQRPEFSKNLIEKSKTQNV
jgi:uncharacterized membrane protein YbaN (DUF454 family)